MEPRPWRVGHYICVTCMVESPPYIIHCIYNLFPILINYIWLRLWLIANFCTQNFIDSKMPIFCIFNIRVVVKFICEFNKLIKFMKNFQFDQLSTCSIALWFLILCCMQGYYIITHSTYSFEFQVQAFIPYFITTWRWGQSIFHPTYYCFICKYITKSSCL